MARPWTDSLKDIAVMEEAAVRMKDVLYAKSYFEKRYNSALSRIVDDLGLAAQTVQLLLMGDDPVYLIGALRSQIEYQRSGKQELFDTLNATLNIASQPSKNECTGNPRTCHIRIENTGPLCNRCRKV